MNSTAANYNSGRLYYTAAAVLMLVLTIVGFNRFYLQGMAYPGREIAPPIKTLVISHGMAMSAWLLLLLIQPILVLRRNIRLHMTLGKIGAGLTALILGLGIALAIQSARYTPAEVQIWGMNPKQFMVVPFVSAWVFTLYVALGIIYRTRPEIHRPMMLLATLSVMSAAVSRIDPLNSLYLGTVWEREFGAFFLTLVIGLILLIVRSVLTRTFDRWFAIGLGALILIDWGILKLGTSTVWNSFASIFVN